MKKNTRRQNFCDNTELFSKQIKRDLAQTFSFSKLNI